MWRIIMVSSGYGTYLHIFTTVYLPHNSNPDFNQNLFNVFNKHFSFK